MTHANVYNFNQDVFCQPIATGSQDYFSVKLLAVAGGTFDWWWTLGPKVRVQILGKVKLSNTSG